MTEKYLCSPTLAHDLKTDAFSKNEVGRDIFNENSVLHDACWLVGSGGKFACSWINNLVNSLLSVISTLISSISFPRRPGA